MLDATRIPVSALGAFVMKRGVMPARWNVKTAQRYEKTARKSSLQGDNGTFLGKQWREDISTHCRPVSENLDLTPCAKATHWMHLDVTCAYTNGL